MNETFNKKALTDALSVRLQISKKSAAEVVDVVLEEVKNELTKGNKVDLAGFGRFEVKERAARDGFNPQTKEKIKVPASKAVTFKVSKALKDEVNSR